MSKEQHGEQKTVTIATLAAELFEIRKLINQKNQAAKNQSHRSQSSGVALLVCGCVVIAIGANLQSHSLAGAGLIVASIGIALLSR